jgi:hypothetical protein
VKAFVHLPGRNARKIGGEFNLPLNRSRTCTMRLDREELFPYHGGMQLPEPLKSLVFLVVWFFAWFIGSGIIILLILFMLWGCLLS